MNMKQRVKSKEIEKREDKWKKLAIALDERKDGEFTKPTPLANLAKIHKDTATYIMDGYDTLAQIGIINFRDENGNWTGTLKSKEFLNTTNALRELRKRQLDQASRVDELNDKIDKALKILEKLQTIKK